MKKKIVSLILAFTFIFSCSYFVVAEEEIQEIQYQSEIEFLKKINILYDDFNALEKITKAEFTVLIAKVLYSDTDFSQAQTQGVLFKDVDTTHLYYSYIKACKDLNIIKGDSSNYFYPDKELSLIEAVTIMINALGYTPYAAAYGGYPTGFYKVAKETGLTKGIDLANQEGIFSDVAAKLIYNSLFADIVTISSVTSDDLSIKINNGKNILSERLNIEELNAEVTDNGIISLIGESANEFDKVLLTDTKTGNRISVYVNETSIGDYIGNIVKVFIKRNTQTGRDEVIYFEAKENTETIINGEHIISVTDSYIEYEQEANSNHSIKLNIKKDAPLVYYNGVHMPIFENDILKPKDGLIRCVDKDKNGNVDFIEILSFNYMEKNELIAYNLVVDNVNTQEQYINCKLNPQNNLDLNSSETNFKFIMSNGVKSLEDLDEYDIVSVAQCPNLIDGKRFYYLVVSSLSMDISVEAINEDEVFVKDQSYKVSSSITSVKNTYTTNIPLNTQITVRLDATGKIAYIDQFKKASKNYAYLINAQLQNKGDETVLVKLLTMDEQIKYLYLSSKATIDGNQCSNAQLQLGALKGRYSEGSKLSEDDRISRPMIVEINSDNLITRIDTDTPNDQDYTKKSNNQYTCQTFIKYTNEEAENEKALKAGYRHARFNNSEIKKGMRTIDGRIYYNNDTTVISVPDIDTYGLVKAQSYLGHLSSYDKSTLNYELIKRYEGNLEDSNYRFISPNSLNYLYQYDIQAYDVDPDTGVAQLLVVRGRNDVYGYGLVPYTSANPMFVFLRKSECYDEETQRTLTKIYYLKDGKTEEDALVNKDDLLFSYQYIIYGCDKSQNPYGVDVDPLKKGDIIRVLKNGNWLTHIERVYRLKDLKSTTSLKLYPTNPRSYYSTVTTDISICPFDVRETFSGNNSSYTLALVYPKQIKGNILLGCLGYKSLNEIDLNLSSSYMDQYFNISNIAITTIEIDTNGVVKIQEGSQNDIKTTNQSDSFNGASMVILRHTDFKINQMFVINDLR